MTLGNQMDLHTLVIPTPVISLLVPSNMVAEVIRPLPIQTIPDTEEWVRGFVIWRNQPVSVLSFEMLCKQPLMAEVARMVVFYPFPGRQAHEFLVLLSSENPYSRQSPDFTDTDASRDIPFIASTIGHEGEEVAVPDFAAIAQILYFDAT